MEQYEHLLEQVRELKRDISNYATGNDSFRDGVRRDLRELERRLDEQLDTMGKEILEKIAAALDEQRTEIGKINTRLTVDEQELAVVKETVASMLVSVERHRKVLYGDEEPGLVEYARVAMRTAAEAARTAQESLTVAKQTADASEQVGRHVSRMLDAQEKARTDAQERRSRARDLLAKAPALVTALVTIVTFFWGLWLRMVLGTDITGLVIASGFGVTIAIFLLITLRAVRGSVNPEDT